MILSTKIELVKISSRTEEILAMLNSLSAAGNGMQMTVLELAPSDDGQRVIGKIQLLAEDLKISFNVVAPTGAHISSFASQFNMASSHYCEIKFELIEPTSLKFTFCPPSQEVATRVENFFELTSIPNLNA